MILNTFSIAGLTLGSTCFILTLFLLIYGRNKVHRIWTLFNFVVGLWGFGAFFIGQATSATTALLAWRLAHIGIIFIPICFFHVVYTFCEILRKKVIIIVYLQGFFFLFLSLTDLFINRVEFVFNSFYYIRASGIFYPIFFTIWTGLVILGHYELVKFYRKIKGIKRIQILYFFLGMLLGFSGGATNFFPVFGINVYPYGNFTIPLYCFIVTYAILRYRLMDIRIAITRTVLSILVFGAVAILPYIILLPFRLFLYETLGKLWWLLPMGASAYGFIASTAPFIYFYFQRRIENRLLREDHRKHRVLYDFSKNAILIRNIDKLLSSIATTLSGTLGITHVAIYLYNKDAKEYILQAHKSPLPAIKELREGSSLIQLIYERQKPLIYEEVMSEYKNSSNKTLGEALKEMQDIGAMVIVPNFIEDELIAFIAMGEKERGAIYTEDDINVLTILANQSALAIKNAQLNKELEISETKRIQNEKFATIGRLATSAKHEIGNPLNIISLNLQATMMKKDLDPDIKKIAEIIFDQVNRIGKVLDDMYGLPKKVEEEMHPISLDELMDRSFELARWQTYWENLGGVDVEKAYPKDLPKIKGNLTLLQGTFLNLIINAYQAMSDAETKEKKITIKAKQDQNNKFLIIEFSNNGPLIPKDTLEKIFEYQYTTKKGASGLGLYIVKHIIEELHKGEIIAKNIPDHGPLFEVRLPIW